MAMSALCQEETSAKGRWPCALVPSRVANARSQSTLILTAPRDATQIIAQLTRARNPAERQEGKRV